MKCRATNPCNAYVYRVCPWTTRLLDCRRVWRSRWSRYCSRLSLLGCGCTCSLNYLCRNLSRTGCCSESFQVCTLWDKCYINDSERKEGRKERRKEGRKECRTNSPPLLFTRPSVCVHKSRTLILPTACILSLLAWTEREKQKQQNEMLIRGLGGGGCRQEKLAQWFT